MMRILALTTAALLAAGTAEAATVTIDGNGITATAEDSTYGEDGWRIEEDGFRYWSSQTYHSPAFVIHDDHGITETGVEKLDGKTFTPKKLSLNLHTAVYLTPSSEAPDPEDFPALDEWARSQPLTGLALRIIGAPADPEGEVSIIELMLGEEGEHDITFGPGFKDIVGLYFVLFATGYDHWFSEAELPTESNAIWCDGYCSQALIHSITIGGDDPAPVPLPASLPLMAGGLAAAAWLRRRL